MKRIPKAFRIISYCAFALVPALGIGVAEAGVPAISGIEVSDITPKSFTASWVVSEPSTGDIKLYSADCVTVIPGAVRTFQGNDSTGLLSVTVSGLSEGTAYCFKALSTSKGTSETTVYPAAPLQVSTEQQAIRLSLEGGRLVPFANSLLKLPDVYKPSPLSSQEGILLKVEVLGKPGGSPNSLLSSQSANYADLNNIYGPGAALFNLSGGERLLVTERHGLGGCVIERYRKAPADLEITAALEPLGCFIPQDIDCNDSVNILDILRAVRWFASSAGDGCFNSEPDLDNNGSVDILDILNVTGSFNATP